MAAAGLPTKLTLEVVTPEGLLLREEVDDVVAPGELGYFGVLPGHTPFLTTLGAGEITYGVGQRRERLTCFWGFCEVLPDRVSIMAELGERAEQIPRRAVQTEDDDLSGQVSSHRRRSVPPAVASQGHPLLRNPLQIWATGGKIVVVAGVT